MTDFRSSMYNKNNRGLVLNPVVHHKHLPEASLTQCCLLESAAYGPLDTAVPYEKLRKCGAGHFANLPICRIKMAFAEILTMSLEMNIHFAMENLVHWMQKRHIF